MNKIHGKHVLLSLAVFFAPAFVLAVIFLQAGVEITFGPSDFMGPSITELELTGLAGILTLGLMILIEKRASISAASLGTNYFVPGHWFALSSLSILGIISFGFVTPLLGLDISFEAKQLLEELTYVRPDILLWIFGFISIAVIVPFYEELFFRGFLYGWLRQKFRFLTSALITSMLFASIHFHYFVFDMTTTVLLGTYLVLIGFATDYFREVFQSLSPAILIHAINNAFYFLYYQA